MIGELINLFKLDLSSNFLSGEIPLTIGNLVNLNSLRLFNNNLDGDIPLTIYNLNKIEFLFLHNNDFKNINTIDLEKIPSLIKVKITD